MCREFEAGHKVIGIAKDSPAAQIRLDATDSKKLEEAVARVLPDVLINAIKPPLSTDEMEGKKEIAYRLNAALPQELAALQEKYGFKLVQISSDWVYDGNEGEVYTEKSLPRPQNYYAQTKALAEEMIVARSKNYLIIRTEGVFGIDEKGTNLFLRIREAAKSGKPILLATDQYSQPIYGGELARITRILVEKGADGIYNVAGPEYMSRYEFGEQVCRRFGFNAKLVPVLAKERKVHAPLHLRVDISKSGKKAGTVKTIAEQFDALEGMVK